MNPAKATLILATLTFLLIGFGCSDKSSNPSDPVPEELVGVWGFVSATVNDVPVSTFSEISHNDEAITGEIEFTLDRTWSTAEYPAGYDPEGLDPIFTQSGTFTVEGSTLHMKRTMYDGDPVSPAYEYDVTFVISYYNQLTITESTTVGSETVTIAATYGLIVSYIK